MTMTPANTRNSDEVKGDGRLMRTVRPFLPRGSEQMVFFWLVAWSSSSLMAAIKQRDGWRTLGLFEAYWRRDQS